MRCKNSKCRDPNSARILLLPAAAQPQFPLERQELPLSPPAGQAGSSAEPHGGVVCRSSGKLRDPDLSDLHYSLLLSLNYPVQELCGVYR